MLTVSTMGLANAPGFFQHRMEDLFAGYLWKYVLVYIDDIIIFSRNLDEHLHHLEHVLDILDASGVSLSISKCFFAFPSIQALGHHVSRLGLSTVQEKTEAIRAMKFPTNLKQLETALGFFGYYRKFVPHYAAMAEKLNNLKTRGFKGVPIKRNARDRHATAALLSRLCPDKREQLKLEAEFEELKSQLCAPTTLAYPDFERPFLLYVDGSQERGFGVALHQIGDDNVERPILYLSKTLSPSERLYWSTELETAALVWALQKLQQYTDHGKVTVYVDHQAIVQSFKDMGAAKGKRSERLTNWKLFLSRYQGRMDIIHVPGKQHINADGLSRLSTACGTAVEHKELNEFPSQYHLDVLWTDLTPNQQAEKLKWDPVFGRIYRQLLGTPFKKSRLFLAWS